MVLAESMRADENSTTAGFPQALKHVFLGAHLIAALMRRATYKREPLLDNRCGCGYASYPGQRPRPVAQNATRTGTQLDLY